MLSYAFLSKRAGLPVRWRRIIKLTSNYREEISRRIQAAGCRTRRDSTRFVDTLITASPSFFKGQTSQEIHAFFERAVNFMKQRVGEENIVSAVVHMDERTPHLHLIFVPLTHDKRLSAKEILGNRAGLSKWQDDFHTYMAENYPDLKRGQSARKTGRVHIPTRVFKQAEDMSRQAQQIEGLLNNAGLLDFRKTNAEAVRLLNAWFPRMEKFEPIMRKYAHLISNLQSENARLLPKAEQADKKNLQKELELSKLKTQLSQLQALVDRIPPDLQKQLQNEQKCTKQR